jgi:hypothetical protein
MAAQRRSFSLAQRRRGRERGGGIKAVPQAFLQAFPNKALAVLWDFKGLQASKT